MVPLPRLCSNCHAVFDEGDPKRRLAVLEYGRALCSACGWLVDHAESDRGRKNLGDLPAPPSDVSTA
jgi:rubredoxin